MSRGSFLANGLQNEPLPELYRIELIQKKKKGKKKKEKESLDATDESSTDVLVDKGGIRFFIFFFSFQVTFLRV